MASIAFEYPTSPAPQDATVQPSTSKDLPDAVLIKAIDAKSADWAMYHYAWELMHWLYEGGVTIETQAEQFLKRRPKEPSDVYQARVERFSYEDHIGTILDWYQASLFEKPPAIEPAVPVVQDGTPDDILSQDMMNDDDRVYFDGLEQNADRAHTPILEMFRKYLKHLLIFGRAAMLVDLPKAGSYNTLAEEKAAKATDPYLVTWDPRQMINCQQNPDGSLEWVVFSARETKNQTPFSVPTAVDHWYYFDRQRFAVYERDIPNGERKAPDGAMARLVANGLHSMAKQNVVPVIYSELPAGLWLMNRAYSAVKNHLNTSNCLDWALMLAALAMPVIKMDGEFELTLTESGFIKLPRDSEYGWSEPDGKSFQHLANRAEALREEIFRQCYLISQARSNSATAGAQSGISKQQDMMASKKILNMFGDFMRGIIQRVYDALSSVREDDITWDVRGMDFPEDPPDAMLDMVATANDLNIPSDTFEKEMYKKAVDSALPDANHATKLKIYDEIDKAPNAQTRDLQAQQQQAQALITSKLNKTDFKGI